MEEKSRLRQAMLTRRQRLTADEIRRAGGEACRQLQPLLADRKTVMLYMPFRGELDTLPLASWLESTGREVVLPITDRRARTITPASVSGLNSLVAGAYGILEPAPGAYVQLAPTQLDAVVVPGVCFDLRGHRIGYGGGYYDRFLPRLAAECLTIGYGYDWQLVPALPPNPWDQPLDWLVTERRTVRIGSR